MNKSIHKTKIVASLFALTYLSSCQHGQISHEMQPAGNNQVYDVGKKELTTYKLDPKLTTRTLAPYKKGIMELGDGIDSSCKIYPSGINFDGEKDVIDQPETYQYSFCTVTKADTEKEKQVLAKAEAAFWTVKASGGLDYMDKSASSETSINNYIIHTFEPGKKKVLINPRLKKEAIELFEKDPALFLKVYGTHYINGFINVISFFGSASLEMKDKNTASNLAATVSAEFKSCVSASGSYKSSSSSNFSKYKETCFCKIQGTSFNYACTTISDLSKAYKEFVNQLNAKDFAIYPSLIICKPWIELTYFHQRLSSNLPMKVFQRLQLSNEAYSKEDVEMLEKLQDGNLNEDERNSPYLLCGPVYKGDLILLKVLLEEYKCNKNVNCGYGYTLLHEAAQLGQLEIVKYLIEQQSFDINVKNRVGKTPLHHVIER